MILSTLKSSWRSCQDDEKESGGERIRQRRKALKLTQQALANGIGVSHVAVSQWEKEETVPRGEHLLRLAELLQCSAAWIIDGDGQPFASTHASRSHCRAAGHAGAGRGLAE